MKKYNLYYGEDIPMSEMSMKKQALLIGINEYVCLTGLKYARQDAEAVADSLKKNYCFSDNEVMLMTDDRKGLFQPVDKFSIRKHFERLANQDLDLFIFGFWGHGLIRKGKRYLCPLNVQNIYAEHQGFPFDELQELLANIHAKNTCLILDCCQTVHDRGVDEEETLTASDQTTMENAARDIGLKRQEQIPGFQSNVAILNSCKVGQSAYEWDARQHGLFTAHLLDAMKKPCDSVMQIAQYISNNIKKAALELGKEQTPFYALEGDIQLPVETKSTPPIPSPIPPLPPKSEENDPFAAFIEEEKRKKLKQIQNLLNEAIESYKNQEFSKAISTLDFVLRLEPNSVEAKELKSLCQSGLELQSAEEERRRRIAEETEQKRREAEQSAEEQRRAEAERKRREEAKKHDLFVPGDKAGDRKTVIVNGAEFAFRWCPPGTFMMGSPESEEGRDYRETQHQVTLTKGFWMMETQVTQKQWKAVIGNNPSYRCVGDDLPVQCVSWNDCQRFCWKCARLGMPIQLPTEAQWEYACRAGTTGAYAGNLDEMAWYEDNSDDKTHPVGTKKPNAWGLYDMHGNVWEWCQDWFSRKYPSWSEINPTGPSSGSCRVIRGGSYMFHAHYCRSSSRNREKPHMRYSSMLGFRVVRRDQ